MDGDRDVIPMKIAEHGGGWNAADRPIDVGRNDSGSAFVQSLKATHSGEAPGIRRNQSVPPTWAAIYGLRFHETIILRLVVGAAHASAPTERLALVRY